MLKAKLLVVELWLFFTQFLLTNLFKPYSTLTLKLTLERRLTELLVVELWLVYRVRRPAVAESCKEFT